MGTTSGWSSAIRDNYRSGPTGFPCASVRFVRRLAAIFGVALVFLPAAAAQASNPSDPPVARQSDPGPPGAVQNVSATVDNGGVVLQWSAPADNGGSTILRYEVRSAEGASVPEGTPWIRTGTFTSFAFRQLTNGTRYSFEVRAVNAQGAGPVAQLQATPGLPPSAPQSLTATADDSGVVLRWSAPADDGGSTILLRYEVRSAEGTSVPEGTPWISNGTLTSRAFPQLTNGTRYSFEVRAVNAWGEGPAARIQATPGQPSAPQSLTAAAEDTGVVLRWSAPANDGGIAILRYEMRSAEGASVPASTRWISTGPRTTGAFRFLTNGTLYSFEVRAVSAWGEGPAARIQATPGQPSAPQSLTATPEDGAVVLRWSSPADEGSSRIAYYQMRYAEGASVPEDTYWSWAGNTIVGVIRQLTNGTLYSFEVRAVNAEAEGPVAQIQATPGFLPSAPRNLTAKASHGAVTLEWNAPADRGSTAIDRYEYRYAEGATVPSETAWQSNANFLSRKVSNLTNGTAYAFEVRAVNGVGAGDATTATATPVRHPTVTVRPEQAAYRFAEGESGASVAIVAQGEQGGDRPSAAFRMAVVTSAVTGGATLSADVEPRSIMIDVEPEDYSEVDGIWQARKSVALSIVDDSVVEADEEFQMNVLAATGVPPWVRFREADGTTACASGGCVMTVTIEDNDGAPSAPQDVVAAAEDGGVVLRWSAPARDGGSNVLRYEMRNAEGASVPAGRRWISTGPSTTGTFRQLTNGTLYSFEVRAVNAEGEGPAAQIQATPGFPPSAPRNLTATASHGEVTLEWNAPADRGSTAIARYEYRYAEGATVPSETAWQSNGRGRFRRVSGLTNGTAYAFEVRAANAVGAGAAATATATPVRHPTITARPEKAAYRFAEGASETSVAIVAEVESGGSRPSVAFPVSMLTKAVSGGAKSPADYETLSVKVLIDPEDFSEVGGIWQARKTVALSIVDDALDEDDENLTVTLGMAPGFPPWAQIREADGTTVCGTDNCLMTVTIEDNDRAPSAPQNFSATPEDGAVTLAWEAPADSGTSAISEYEYRHAEGESVPEKRDWISAGSDLTATVGSLTEGTTYTFEVRAVSDAGGGAPASATAGPLTVPAVPQEVVAAAEDGGIVLRWSAPADNGGSNIQRYQMRNAEGASVPASTRWISTGPRTTGAFRFLTNGTLYSFEVRAVNAEGDGPAAQIQATPGFPPSAPQNLTATARHGAVNLIWEAPADPGSTAITGYEYRYAEGAAVPSGTVWEASGRNLSRIVDGLTNSTAYAFEVRAVNDVGAGDAATVTATPVRHPTVTVRPEKATYSFAEGASETSVAIVAQGEQGDGRPNVRFGVRVLTKEVSGGAKSRADYAALSVEVFIDPEDFSEVEGIWQARKTVALSIVDDALDEDDENLTVTLATAAGSPLWAQIREADGTTVCAVDGCLMTVTIEDNDRAPSAPQNFSATPEDGAVTLAWEAPADSGTSAISEYEYRHAEGESVPEEKDWISAGSDLTATVGSLTEGTTYAFEVRAVSEAGGGAPASATAGPLTLPSVPQDVVAAAEDGGIVLRWSAPADNGGSNILHYEMRSAEGASVPASTRWISTGPRTTGAFRFLTNGTLYSFEVRAVNAQGDGPAAQIQATPGFPIWAQIREADGTTVCAVDGCLMTVTIGDNDNAPSAPQNLSATPGDGQVTLAWEAPADSGTSAISEYEYRHAKGESVPKRRDWISAGTDLTATIGSLTEGTTYAFEVRAVSEAGGGAPASATAGPLTVPSVPQDVVAAAEDGGVVLRWSAPADDGGSNVLHYEMRSAEGVSVPASTRWISTGPRTTGAFRFLTNGTLYSFEVRAVNAQGDGPAAQIQATPGLPPSAPQNLSATPGDEQVTLGWSAPTNDGGADIARYEVRHAAGASVPGDTEWTALGLVTTYTVSDLTNGTAYAFEVRAVSDATAGEAATTAATPATVPGLPQNFSTTPGDGEVVLTWQAPASNGGSAVTEYEYRHAEGTSVPDETAWQSAGASLTAAVDSLTNGTEYTFEVRAVNAEGEGEAAAISATPVTVPGPPQNFSTTPGDGEVVLTWQAPASNGGSAVTEYEYRHAEGASVPDETAWQSAGTSLTATVDSLTNDTAYAFEVRAVNAVGEGEAATVTGTPREQATAPSAPRNLAAMPGDGEAILTWQVPASDGGSPILGYAYRYAEGASVPPTQTWKSIDSVLTVMVGNLTNGAEYTFEVRAVNAEGEGEASATSATPSANPVVTVHPAQAAYRFAEGATGPEVAIVARTGPDARTPSETFYVSVSSQAVSDGATSPDDFEALSEIIAFEPGDFSAAGRAWEARKTIPLALVDDAADEGDESFNMVLQSTLGSPRWVQLRDADDTGACGLGGCVMTVTIEDDDRAASAPQNLTATPGDGQVALTWEAPADPGSSEVSGYEYRHAEGATVPSETAWQSAGLSLTAMIDSLTNDTGYAFEVRAVSDAGEGDAATATATPAVQPTVPSVPQSLVATPGDGEVVLTWQAPASNGGSAVTEYEYRHAEGEAVPDETAWQSAGTRLTATVDSLINGTEYAFEVRAVNAEGEGGAAAKSATPATVPGVPQSLVATPGDGEVVLTWQAPADNGGSAVTGYEYRHAEGATVPPGTAWQSAGTALTATVDSLTNGTEYAFEVRAVNAVGDGSAATTAATPVTVPGPPQNFSTTPGDGEVVLTWQTPASNGGSAVTEYEYRHAKGASVPDETAWQSAGTSLTATVDSLTNGTEYAFEVRAVNAEGEGEAATATVTPAAQPTVPSVPQSLAATPGDGEVVLTWQALASNGGSAVTEYEYRHAEGASVPDETAWQSAGTSLTATVDGLTNGTEYAFEVRAVNAEGEGKAAAISATPATVPGLPQSLAATPGDGEVVLTWQAPASNGGSAVTGYEYRHAEGTSVPDETAWQSAGTSLTATVDSLTNGTEYAFEVRAVNAEGEGEAAAMSATPTTVPGLPQSLAATPGDGEVVLTWQAPASNGGSPLPMSRSFPGATHPTRAVE